MPGDPPPIVIADAGLAAHAAGEGRAGRRRLAVLNMDEHEGGNHICVPVNAVVETEKLIIRASGSLRKLVLAVEAGA